MDLSDSDDLPGTIQEVIDEVKQLTKSAATTKLADPSPLKSLLALLCDTCDLPENRIHRGMYILCSVDFACSLGCQLHVEA